MSIEAAGIIPYVPIMRSVNSQCDGTLFGRADFLDAIFRPPPSGRARGSAGRVVGEVARKICDPGGVGTLVDVKAGLGKAHLRSRELLLSSQPIFEGGYVAGGASAFADVLLPVGTVGSEGWRMVEVKSATEVMERCTGW
jgi:hypothetical protein